MSGNLFDDFAGLLDVLLCLRSRKYLRMAMLLRSLVQPDTRAERFVNADIEHFEAACTPLGTEKDEKGRSGERKEDLCSFTKASATEIRNFVKLYGTRVAFPQRDIEAGTRCPWAQRPLG